MSIIPAEYRGPGKANIHDSHHEAGFFHKSPTAFCLLPRLPIYLTMVFGHVSRIGPSYLLLRIDFVCRLGEILRNRFG